MGTGCAISTANLGDARSPGVVGSARIEQGRRESGVHALHQLQDFFAVSVQLIARILVDAARARAAVKRGGKGSLARVSAEGTRGEVYDRATRVLDRRIKSRSA